MRWITTGLLLLATCTTVLAQAPVTPGIPLLVAQIEDRAVPIELETLDARVRIHGFLAETTLELTFFNSDPRRLEGDFLLSLPDGAVVSGYGLDVDGVLVDGVVVEKDKARIVFERELRRDVDPGLIEWVGGNLFRTRVYPIEGESRRTIRVRYAEKLDFRRGKAVYRLPLGGLPKLRKVGLSVEVFEPDRRPRIRRHPFAQLEERLEAGVFSAGASADDLEPGEDLEIVLAAAQRTMVLAEGAGGEVAFAVADFRPPRSSTRRTSPRRLALFWDASFSRQATDSGKALELIAGLLRQWRPAAVSLTVFRDRAEAPVSFDVRHGRCSELLATLSEVVYDGATEWRGLELPPGFGADGAVLLGDGRITFGSRRLPDLGVPTYVFGSGVDPDGPLLRHLAESTGGAFFDLTARTPGSILEELRRAPVSLRQVEVSVDRGEVRELEAPIGRPVDGGTVVTGLLVGEAARLTLVYGGGDGEERRRSVALRARPPASGLVSRFRAQQKLGRLALFPQENRQQLLSLGREHGLVTPETSLLVLEDLEQYLQYEVEPPASLAEMRREYHQEMEEIRQEARDVSDGYLEFLREQWREYLAWSGRSFDVPPPAADQPGEPPPRPEREPESAVGSESRAADQPRRDPLAARPAVARTVRGVVTDDGGGPMPGVTVRLESESLLAPLTLTSDAEGVYQTPVLTPGDYEISFSLEGFSTVERLVRVGRDEDLRLDVMLSLAFAEEMHVVTGVIPAKSIQPARDIVLQPWTPEVPYLDAFAAVPDDGLYGAYLEQRRAYGSSPAFFVDCSRLFFDRGLRPEGLRIASNLLELGVEDPRLIRGAANLFLGTGAWDRAVALFETLVRLRPELPQSNRDLAQALILRAEARQAADPAAARRDFQRAAGLLYQVAFEPWGPVASPLQIAYSDEARFEEIGRIALVEYNWVLHKLESLPAAGEEVVQADATWIQPVTADLRIVLSWNDEFADMDLWVIEPSGEKVYFGHPRSAAGGLLSEDCTSGLGPESYVAKKAMPGTYRILVDYFGGVGPELLGPVTVQTLIVTGFGTDAEQIELESVRLDTSGDTMEIGTIVIGDGRSELEPLLHPKLPPSWNEFWARSLRAQGGHRVDAGGAAGGQEAGEHRCRQEQERHGEEGDRVGGGDAVEEAAHQVGRGEGAREAQGDAQGGQEEPLPHHQPHHALARGAEGDTHPDLLVPLRHLEGDDAVDADDGEQERRGSEETEQEELEAALFQRAGEDLLERLDAGSDLRVDVVDQPSHRAHQGFRIALRDDDDVERPGEGTGTLPRVGVEGGPRRRFQARFADVSDDPDDGERTQVAVHVAELDQLADRILRGPGGVGQRLADHGDMSRLWMVSLVEQPAVQQRDPHRPEVARRGPAVLRVATAPGDLHDGLEALPVGDLIRPVEEEKRSVATLARQGE